MCNRSQSIHDHLSGRTGHWHWGPVLNRRAVSGLVPSVLEWVAARVCPPAGNPGSPASSGAENGAVASQSCSRQPSEWV